MVRIVNSSVKAGHQVIVPETGGIPDRSKLSGTGKGTDAILIDIYFNQYLIDGVDSGASGDYLVYSAELSCTNGVGSPGAFLHLEETVDKQGNRKIGHGALINGLPQANKNDAKAKINIDGFGGCRLLSYEEPDVQNSIINSAARANCDICSYIRNLINSWITPSESGLMEVGGAKAINTNSFLLCYPTIIQKYADQGMKGGKIEAVDSGQSHLDDLLKEYRDKYLTEIGNAVTVPLFNSFSMQYVYEFVYLYEVRYPERERALVNFFRKVDDTLLEDILKIKCMTYMLEERTVRRMTELMGEKGGIFIEMFSGKNPAPDGSQAFFTTTFLGKPKIMYYDIASKRSDVPPYKTFFHEFGHAIDYISKTGSGYYTDDFTCMQTAYRKQLIYDSNVSDYHINTVIETNELSIHEWAEVDLENCLVQVAFELLKGKISSKSTKTYLNTKITPLMQYEMFLHVIYNQILIRDAAPKSSNLLGIPNAIEINDLYIDICQKINKEILVAVNGSPVLPLDLFGGLTKNQVGGGHGEEYWFNKKGERINTISKEAFAGYFEYKVTVFNLNAQESLINPKLLNGMEHCFTYTTKALEVMFNHVV